MVEKYQPAEESGIDFDLRQRSSSLGRRCRSAGPSPGKRAKGRRLRFSVTTDHSCAFVWWTLRTVVSFVVPPGVFFAIQKCKLLVDFRLSHGQSRHQPISDFEKGAAWAHSFAVLIAAVPALTGVYLGSLLYRFKNLKPVIAMSIWCVLIFLDCLVLVLVAKYFGLILDIHYSGAIA